MNDSESDQLAQETANRMSSELNSLAPDLEILEQLQEQLSGSSQSGDVVSRLVFQDPAILIILCQNLYSVQQGLGDPFGVTNPWQMIVRLGVQRVRGLLTDLKVRQQPPLAIEQAFARYRGQAVRVAEFGRVIARNVNPQLTDIGELLGLLGGVGNMLGLLHHRERLLAVLEATPNHAKAHYRLLKELNFNAPKVVAEFLRGNGLPEKFVVILDRDSAVGVTAGQSDLRSVFLSAVELSNAFAEDKAALYAPGKSLPSMSSLRLLQLREQDQAKLYAELLEVVQAAAVRDLNSGQESTSLNHVQATQKAETNFASKEEAFQAKELVTSEVSASKAPVIPKAESPVPQIAALNLADEIRFLDGFRPTPARIKRMQRIRDARALQSSENLNLSGANLAGDSTARTASPGMQLASSAIDSLVRDNPLIIACVRGIRSIENISARAGASASGSMRDLSVAMVKPISDRVVRYQAALYFAALQYYPNRIAERISIQLDEAIALLAPAEVSAVVSLTYLAHQLESNCEERQWRALVKNFKLHTEIGRLVFSNIPGLSASTGMLLAGVRYLSLGVLLARAPDKFAEYSANMKLTKKLVNHKIEFPIFGTSHLEIGALFLQRLGFGVKLSTELLPNGFEQPDFAASDLSSKHSKIALALMWTESIHSEGTPFAVREFAAALGVDRTELITLRDKVKAIIQTDKPSSWFGRDKEDLLIDGRCQLPHKKKSRVK